MPGSWIRLVGPKGPKNVYYDPINGFTRDWQTFWAMLVTSMILTLCFVSFKSERTAITENKLL